MLLSCIYHSQWHSIRKGPEAALDFFTTLLKVDTSLVVYEYLLESERWYKWTWQHSKKISRIKTYFNGGYCPASKGVDIWPLMKLGITTDPEIFIADAKCLLEDKYMSIFMKDLQAESTETVGYFLFSQRKQNRDRLKDTIQYYLKICLGIEEELSIRLQKIAQNLSLHHLLKLRLKLTMLKLFKERVLKSLMVSLNCIAPPSRDIH